MKYYDYEWDLHKDKIVLDAQLNTDKLEWHHGDYFRFENHDGKQVLVKVDPLRKFLKDGEQNGHS